MLPHRLIKVKGQLVQMLDWKQADGQTRPIASPGPLTSAVGSVKAARVDCGSAVALGRQVAMQVHRARGHPEWRG